MKHLKLFEQFDEFDPFKEEIDENEKKELIEYIKRNVIKYGGNISMSDMESESSPIYQENQYEIGLIERLYSDAVGVVMYDGYRYEDVLGEYEVEYESLQMDTLREIKKAIKFDLLKEKI